MKEKIPKPRLNRLSEWLFGGITGIVGIISFVSSSVSEKKINFNIHLSLVILIILVLIISITFIITYIIDVNKKYKKYEQQFEEFEKINSNNKALIETLEKRQLEIKKLTKNIEEYEMILNSIIGRIQQGACDISDEEKKYLNNLYHLVLNDKSYLFKMNVKNIEENGEN